MGRTGTENVLNTALLTKNNPVSIWPRTPVRSDRAGRGPHSRAEPEARTSVALLQHRSCSPALQPRESVLLVQGTRRLWPGQQEEDDDTENTEQHKQTESRLLKQSETEAQGDLTKGWKHPTPLPPSTLADIGTHLAEASAQVQRHESRGRSEEPLLLPILCTHPMSQDWNRCWGH